MQEKNTDFRLFYGVVVIGFITTLMLFEELDRFYYDKNHPLQVWRLITSHFVHFDSVHMLSNMFAYGLMLYLFPTTLKQQILAVTFAMIAINGYLIFSNVIVYAGFSGLVYTIPGITFGRFLQQKRYQQSIIMLVILFTYIFLISPQTHAGNITWQPNKPAHLIGFLSGLLTHFFTTSRYSALISTVQLSQEPHLFVAIQQRFHPANEQKPSDHLGEVD